MRYYYRTVNPFRVSASNKEIAAAVLAYCEKDLRLLPVTLSWYEPVASPGADSPPGVWAHDSEQTDSTHLAGMAITQGVPGIRILMHLTKERTALVVAHECRHLWQSVNDAHYNDYTVFGQAKVEADAERYAEKAVAAVRKMCEAAAAQKAIPARSPWLWGR